MNTSTPHSSSQAALATLPRPSANPIVWWVAGGLSVLGVGALAAALMNSPKADVAAAEPAPTATVSRAKNTATARQTTAAICTHCGTVESVKAEKQKGEATGLGAVGGAVVGGVVGHQVGNGNGKKAMTVLGAVGGGLAGHEIEKHARATTVYHVQLRMDDGSTRTITQNTAPTVGARVELQGNELKLRPTKG